MSDYSNVITSKEAVKLIASRTVSEVTLKSVVTSANSLDVENLDPQTFRRLESKYNSEILLWEKANKSLISLIVKHDSELATHEDFLAEIDRIRKLSDKWSSDFKLQIYSLGLRKNLPLLCAQWLLRKRFLTIIVTIARFLLCY